MCDITKCLNTSCPMKQNCYRYMSIGSERQAYCKFEPVDGKCDHFWQIEKGMKVKDLSQNDT